MTKEVRFDLYCSHCVYAEQPGIEDPCDECLANGSNEDSHQPINFKRNDIPFIFYLLPDPNVPNYTLDRAQSENWKDSPPTKNDIKLYFEKRENDYYEKGDF